MIPLGSTGAGRRQPQGSARAAGFTLAEVAVTIVIVGMALVLCLQGLSGSKLQAAQTRNYKLARELGLQTLGEVGAGLWAGEVTDGLDGSYADRGHPEFSYELVVGEDQFIEETAFESGRYDSWRDSDEDEEDEEEQTEQPYEKVRIRVTFPQIQEYENTLTLEQWFPWQQVYGDSEEREKAGLANENNTAADAGAAGAAGALGAAGGGTAR
jgi:prepilin-type N-terminal cleavage/methylation domain-containing protein